MANIIITTDLENVYVEFNDMCEATNYLSGVWRKNGIYRILKAVEYCEISFAGSTKSWQISTTSVPAPNTLLIDSVNGVACTDTDHLFFVLKEALL